MVATNGGAISTASPSKYIQTTGPGDPGGLHGASATWFIAVFLLFIIMLFFFLLLACIRGQRLNEGQTPFYSDLLVLSKLPMSPFNVLFYFCSARKSRTNGASVCSIATVSSAAIQMLPQLI